MANVIEGNLYVAGRITADSMTLPDDAVTNASVHASAAIARSKLAQDTLKAYPINFTDLRVWDAFQTNLPGTSAADDLGLYGGTFATDAPLVRTYDVKNAGAVTLYARFMVRIPIEYDAAQTILLRATAGMETTVASASATIDFQAYECTGSGSISADLVTTSATSINSLTYADCDFTVTGTDLVGGNILDVRMTIAVNDAATATAVIAAVSNLYLVCDIRG
jgi:hypothetical protein